MPKGMGWMAFAAAWQAYPHVLTPFPLPNPGKGVRGIGSPHVYNVVGLAIGVGVPEPLAPGTVTTSMNYGPKPVEPSVSICQSVVYAPGVVGAVSVKVNPTCAPVATDDVTGAVAAPMQLCTHISP